MARMTDDELRALTDSEMRWAIGYWGGKLGEQRRKAEYYYLGLAKEELSPPEVAGRSSVVAPVVRNTIEAMLPQLMVKFTGGETVVEFEPTKPADEQKAKQCTDYLNYLFFKKANGHAITLSWFKDALLQKRGIVKCWWDTRTEETREEYRGLDPVELAQLDDDSELEITEQKSYPDEEDDEKRQKAIEQITQQMQQAAMAAQQGNPQAMQALQQMQAQVQAIQAQPPAMLFDVTCKRTKKGGKVCIENVPPEEFLINRQAKDIAQAPFVGHRVKRTASELLSMGYPKSKIDNISSDDGFAMNAERIERLSVDDEYAYTTTESASSDPSQRTIWVTECYIRCDYDGDGIAELRKVVRAGNEILDNEIVDIAPFVSICPVPLPHKFYGLSIADLAFEGQKTETALLRANLDNLYLEVNGRYFAVDGQVNLDDLLTSRPGGVVRIKSQGAVGRLDQGKGNISDSMSMLEYVKQMNEDSTGWSRQSQGNDPSALNSPETATKANIVANKADMRTDLIARNFAEGFVELFRMMLKLVCQYQDGEAEVKIAGEWVRMDPREWRNQFDVTINVGLGVGSKDQQVMHLMTLFQAMGNGMQVGVVKPENVYNVLSEMAKNMGFKSADKFVSKPDPNWRPPDPHAGQMQIEQMKAQTHAQNEQAKLQAHGQIEQMKLQAQMQAEAAAREHEAQLEQVKAQMQAEVDRNRQASEAEQKTLEMQQEAQLEQLKAQYADQQHQREQEVAFAVAKLQAETSVIVAQIGAASKPAPGADGEGAAEPAPAGPDQTGVLATAMAGFTAAIESINRPKTVQRGSDGRVTGIA